MKKLFTLLALIATIATFAQAPQGFNYQATVRNSSGALMVSQNVYFKFNVMLNSSTSVPVFTETHYVPTDDLGAVNLIIGKGTPTIGTFASVDWGTGNYYLGIELNTGSGYVAMGTTQLLSVPYALYAEESGNSSLIEISSTEVFNGAPPTTWTDLDLSSVVGTNKALVMLKVTNLSSSFINVIAFRQNGDKASYSTTQTPTGANKGGLASEPDSNIMMTYTDANGIIEWKSSDSKTVKIEVEVFIK